MARSKLTKEEKETILLTSEADNVWSIFTYNPALKRKLKKYSDEHPDLCQITAEDVECGSATFSISKSRVSIRLLKPVSDAKKHTARANARRNGLSS